MLNVLRSPIFSDPDKTQRARLVHILSWTCIITVPFPIGVMLTFLAENRLNPAILGALMPIFAAAMLINMRGHVRTAAYLIAGSIWFAVVVIIVPYGGVTDRAFSWLFVPILILGLIVEGNSAFALAMITSAIGLIQTAAADFPAQLVQAWVGNSAFFIVSALLLRVSYQNAATTLMRVSVNERAAKAISIRLSEEIAEHHRTNSALQGSENRYRQLLDMLPVAVAIMDIESKTMVYANQTIKQMVGLQPDEKMIGRAAKDFLTKEYQLLLDERMSANPDPSVSLGQTDVVDWVLLKQDKSTVLVDTAATVVLYDGKPAVLSVYIDQTERIQIQEVRTQAERLRSELEREKQDIAVRESMLNTASHQFRTPLTIILSSEQMLEVYGERMTVQQRQRHYEAIQTQVTYMVALLEDLLTLNKSNAGKLDAHLVPLEIVRFCEQLIAEFASSHPDHLFTFEGDIFGSYLLDPKLMRHIINNLLSNAAKYSPAGSTVSTVLHTCDQEAIIEIIDHGIGIPLEEQGRLFEAYFRGSNARHVEGTGLGLLIVKNSVIALGGQISLVSQPNSTIFTVRLPLHPANATASV